MIGPNTAFNRIMQSIIDWLLKWNSYENYIRIFALDVILSPNSRRLAGNVWINYSQELSEPIVIAAQLTDAEHNR